MTTNHFTVLLLFVCILNGMFSPVILLVMSTWPAWFPVLLLDVNDATLFYLSSLIVATSTLLISGVPAAVYERLAGRKQSDLASRVLWLAGALLLSLPAIQRLVALT